MAGETRNLTVSLSLAARVALDEIWDWNVHRYGLDHANEYLAFLLAETNKLATNYFLGKTVPALPQFSYIVIKRRRKGHGHLAVYELIGEVIHVLNYYHTAEDWQSKFTNETE